MEDRERYSIDLLKSMAERTIKRLWVLVILLIVLLVATNGAWLWYESQWETVQETTQTVTQEGSGANQFVGGDYYGTANG